MRKGISQNQKTVRPLGMIGIHKAFAALFLRLDPQEWSKGTLKKDTHIIEPKLETLPANPNRARNRTVQAALARK